MPSVQIISCLVDSAFKKIHCHYNLQIAFLHQEQKREVEKKKKKTWNENATETSSSSLNVHGKHTRRAHFKIKQMSYFKCFIAKLEDCSHYY